MGGNTGDVLLKFEAQLFERGDVVDSGNLVEPDESRGCLELVGRSFHERRIDLRLVGCAEAEALGLGDDLNGGVFELELGTLLRKEIAD